MKITMSFLTFKNRTGLDGHAEKRGPKIRAVDQAFDEYETRFNVATLDDKIALTAALFKVCKDWLKKKEGKSLFKERLLRPTVFNTNLANRKSAIQDVAEQCLDALAQLDPALWARTEFDRHKVRSLAGGERMMHAKALAPGYNLERESWLHSKKTRAIGGSGLSDEVHMLNSKSKKKLSDLSFSDYAKLDKLADGGTVKYLRKAERLDKMMVLNDDSLLCHALTPDMPATTTDRAFPTPERMPREWLGIVGFDRQLWMYAMDSYGNLFISPAATEAAVSDMLNAGGFRFFNHSSFNAGREVTCAGMICIQAGVLRWIDNNSGHYKPSPDKVCQAIKLLAADGADVSGTVIGIGVYSGPHGHLSAMQCYWGRDFLEHGHEGAAPFLVL
jgi:hypothetical protein